MRPPTFDEILSLIQSVDERASLTLRTFGVELTASGILGVLAALVILILLMTSVRLLMKAILARLRKDGE